MISRVHPRLWYATELPSRDVAHALGIQFYLRAVPGVTEACHIKVVLFAIARGIPVLVTNPTWLACIGIHVWGETASEVLKRLHDIPDIDTEAVFRYAGEIRRPLGEMTDEEFSTLENDLFRGNERQWWGSE